MPVDAEPEPTIKFETPKADLLRFDGKAVEFFEYYDTTAVLATTR